MLGVSGLWAADLARSLLRGLQAQLHAPLPLKRFLECPLTAPLSLSLTRFPQARNQDCQNEEADRSSAPFPPVPFPFPPSP